MAINLIRAILAHVGTLVHFDDVWMTLEVIAPATGQVRHSVCFPALLMYFNTTLDTKKFFNILGSTDRTEDQERTVNKKNKRTKEFDNFIRRLADHTFNQATKSGQGQKKLPKPLYSIMNAFLDSKMAEPTFNGNANKRPAWFSLNPAFSVENIRKRALVRPDKAGNQEQKASHHHNNKMCKLLEKDAKKVKLLLDDGCIAKMTLQVTDSSRKLTEQGKMMTQEYSQKKKSRKRSGTAEGEYGYSPKSTRMSRPDSALGSPSASFETSPPTTAPGSPSVSELSIGSRAPQYSGPRSPASSQETLAAQLNGVYINDLEEGGYFSASSRQVSELSLGSPVRGHAGYAPPGENLATQLGGRRGDNWTTWTNGGSEPMAVPHLAANHGVVHSGAGYVYGMQAPVYSEYGAPFICQPMVQQVPSTVLDRLPSEPDIHNRAGYPNAVVTSAPNYRHVIHGPAKPVADHSVQIHAQVHSTHQVRHQPAHSVGPRNIWNHVTQERPVELNSRTFGYQTCIEESEKDKRDRELRAVLNKRSPPQPQSRPMVVPQSKHDIANEKHSELQRNEPENTINSPECKKNGNEDLDKLMQEVDLVLNNCVEEDLDNVSLANALENMMKSFPGESGDEP